MSSIWLHLSQISGTDKAPGRRHDAVGPRGEGDPQGHRIIKFVVGYFELDSVLLTEGSILDLCYKIEELLR
jgi:hypothetical protein